ncbi:hypothetical protein GCM10023231_00280 [Olivibacter ginsenosidimutans]|uniref:Uncharacterized protein n=1 Tax=Olivibacter ginsenosidimutans TaxID=1176537 RepID=A0ABP9ABG9_9SPHI
MVYNYHKKSLVIRLGIFLYRQNTAIFLFLIILTFDLPHTPIAKNASAYPVKCMDASSFAAVEEPGKNRYTIPNP